MVKLRRIC
jgi:hypothetical protein